MPDQDPEKYPEPLRAELMSHPTSIRAELAHPSSGRIVTLGFPGLFLPESGSPTVDPARMRATLTDAALSSCKLLIILLEKGELPPGAWDLLEAQAAEISLPLRHMPIPDYQAPDASFEAAWEALQPDLTSILSAGQTVALSCHYGAGRSGTMAACLLLDAGQSLDVAVNSLRSAFPDSIESECQLDWLRSRASRLR